MINWVFRAMIIKLTLHCILEIKHCNWNHGYWSYQNFSTEATLAKCHNCLSSFGVPASSTNRKTRMMNLTSSWDSSRKKLFEAVLAFKSLPSPNCCNFCFRGKVQVQCAVSPVKFMRSSCDEKVHKRLFSTTEMRMLTGISMLSHPLLWLMREAIRKLQVSFAFRLVIKCIFYIHYLFLFWLKWPHYLFFFSPSAVWTFPFQLILLRLTFTTQEILNSETMVCSSF